MPKDSRRQGSHCHSCRTEKAEEEEGLREIAALEARGCWQPWASPQSYQLGRVLSTAYGQCPGTHATC